MQKAGSIWIFLDTQWDVCLLCFPLLRSDFKQRFSLWCCLRIQKKTFYFMCAQRILQMLYQCRACKETVFKFKHLIGLAEVAQHLIRQKRELIWEQQAVWSLILERPFEWMNDTLEKTDVVTEEHWIPVLLSDKAQHFKKKINKFSTLCRLWTCGACSCGCVTPRRSCAMRWTCH